MSDNINPEHYKRLPVEAIEIIESAIEKAPTKVEAYLQGQALKYLLRANHKNGREDMLKAKWYLDRMVASFTVSSDLLDHSSWTPRVGDWVKIKKPADSQTSATSWWPSMDKYDEQIIQVKQIEEDGVVLEEWGFMFDWLEPAEPQKEQPQLPNGWRWLEVGEMICKGDMFFNKVHGWRDYDLSTGQKLSLTGWPSIRRNRFVVGEKVVKVFSECVYEITAILDSGCYEMQTPSGYKIRLYAKDLAPYIEETT